MVVKTEERSYLGILRVFPQNKGVPMSRTAYPYSRFSDLSQGKGRSEGRQNDPVAEYCRHHGFILDDTLKFNDRGRSGFHGHNIKHGINQKLGALGTFLELLKEGIIKSGSLLIIEHVDRFTRLDPMSGLNLIQEVINRGVDIVTLMDNEVYTQERLRTDLGVLIKLTILLSQGHNESSKKSSRLLDVWKSRRSKMEKGEVLKGRKPTWLNKDGTVNEVKAAVIRRIFALAAEGLGSSRIAKILNTEDVPLIGKGKNWGYTLIYHHLGNRAVLGEYQSHQEVGGRDVPIGDPIPGYYPAIVDQTTFLKVQHHLAARSRIQVCGRNPSANLFAHLITNLYDGGTYQLKISLDKRNGEVYRYKKLYPAYHKSGVKDSMDVPIQYNSFEESFFRFVKEIETSSIFSTGNTEKESQLAILEGEILDLTAKIATLKDKVKKSKHVETFLDLIESSEEERQIKEKEASGLRAELTTSEAKLLQDLKTKLNDPNEREKVASIIRLLIDKIIILPIHIKTGQHRKYTYNLYVEVHFHNRKTRYYSVDEEGKTAVLFDHTKAGGMDFTPVEVGRKILLPMLIDDASPLWKDRLKARFPEDLALVRHYFKINS